LRVRPEHYSRRACWNRTRRRVVQLDNFIGAWRLWWYSWLWHLNRVQYGHGLVPMWCVILLELIHECGPRFALDLKHIKVGANDGPLHCCNCYWHCCIHCYSLVEVVIVSSCSRGEKSGTLIASSWFRGRPPKKLIIHTINIGHARYVPSHKYVKFCSKIQYRTINTLVRACILYRMHVINKPNNNDIIACCKHNDNIMHHHHCCHWCLSRARPPSTRSMDVKLFSFHNWYRVKEWRLGMVRGKSKREAPQAHRVKERNNHLAHIISIFSRTTRQSTFRSLGKRVEQTIYAE